MVKKRQSLRNEDDEDDDRIERNEWLTRLAIMAIGIILIAIGGWNITTGAIGTALVLGPLFESPEFRLLVKVSINRVSGKQVFQVEQSHISGSNVVGVAGEVHFHEAPKAITPPLIAAQPQPQDAPQREDWEVDEEFILTEGEDYRHFPVDLESGDELVGYVEADGDVSCYVFGRASFRSFREEETFNPYWAKQRVTKTKVSFVAEGARTYYFVVENNSEDENVSVSVRLRVQEAVED